MSANGPTTFEEIASKQRTRGMGCPLCGDGTRNDGSVEVHLQRFGPGSSTLKGGGRVRSKAVSMCEAHAVEIYVEFEALFLKRVGMEHLIGVLHK